MHAAAVVILAASCFFVGWGLYSIKGELRCRRRGRKR